MAISLEIIDVELCIRIGLTSGLESNADEIFAEDLREDTITERAILIENLVDDILVPSASLSSTQTYTLTQA